MNAETDKLFDTTPSHLAQVFGAKTVRLIREGRDPYEAARLAGSFAEKVLAERRNVIGRITPDCPWGIQ